MPWVKEIHTSKSGNEALAMLHTTVPDIVFMDYVMPGMDGPACTKKIKQLCPAAKVVAFSTFTDYYRVLNMFDAGATGYLYKGAVADEITQCTERVMNGSYYFDHSTALDMHALLAERLKQEAGGSDTLTLRELEILKLLFYEYSTKEIAEALQINERSVETHRTNMMKKTKARNVVGIIKYGVRNGFLKWKE